MSKLPPVSGKPVIYIDFEYNRVNNEFVNLVCCSLWDGEEVLEFWLHDDPEEQGRLKKFLLNLKDKVYFFSYAAVAEGRAFLSLGLDPFNFNWVDGFLEYRCLTNHNDHLLFGKQLVNGRVKNVRKPPPKWERTEEDSATMFKPTHSLAEATYKLTGEMRDTEHKDRMRDLIISDPEFFTEEEQQDIRKYCTEDVLHLPAMFKAMQDEYYYLGIEVDEELEKEMLLRGKYAALTAKMESWGYPIDVQKTQNFSEAVSPILEECQREINNLFPEIKPFRWNRPEKKFSWDQKATKKWLEENVDTERWMKTDGGGLSLSADAWQRVFDFKHDYPKNLFGAQMVRYLKLKQSLHGFTPNKNGSFWDAVGPDGRVRPYTNPFGAQSSRSQQGARSFLFLKPAFMRALCMPEKGKAIAGIDYGSEEFLISALLSWLAICPNKPTTPQIDAYASGDVYLAFAKAAGMVPPEGTKASHKFERDLCKATVLGLSYLMSKYGLAAKLSADTGREFTVEEAQEFIDLFYETYPELKEWQELILEQYEDDGFLKLPCVAKGTPIFTESGVKNIEDVTVEDLIWDGKVFVKHGGVVLKGEKDAILSKKMNLNATPDHWILCRGVWKTLVEAEAEEDFQPHSSEKFSEDGRLLAEREKWGEEGVSVVAVYAALKKKLESIHCNLERLEPVLTALNLLGLKGQSPKDIATSLVTNIFSVNGGLASITPELDAKIKRTSNTPDMEVEGFFFASTPLEYSWNTLLHWMGILHGRALSTELIMTGTMSLETYESLAKERTTKIEVYDILNCGLHNRFQAGKIISHNCGWYMWGPNDRIGNEGNDNFRSTTNVPVQGFGGSILRKAVELCVEAGLKPIITLHDALYIEYDAGDFAALDKFHDCMKEAFIFYFRQFGKQAEKNASLIKMDPFSWSPDYESNSEIVTPAGRKIPVSNIYIDERAESEYNQFSRYFENREENLL